MAPEIFKLLSPLVDVQPVYDCLPVVQSDDEIYSPEMRAFLVVKLRESAKTLRRTAKHIEQELLLVEAKVKAKAAEKKK